MPSPVSPANRSRLVLIAVVAMIFVVADALGQTPGTVASNPFANGITAGVTVRIGDVAVLPNSDGAKARLNSASLTPDGRFFVADQRGPVYSLTAAGAYTQYFSLATAGLNLQNDNGERGVSAIAFHPQFTQVGTPGYGKFYASFSTTSTGTSLPIDSQVGTLRDHDEVVYEFTAANPLASTYTAGATPRQVLRVAKPNSNHNGGQIAFNPNAAVGSADYGLLYVSEGDSGGGGDPNGVGQNTSSLLGKILRVDPLGTSGPGGRYGIPAANAFQADGDTATRGEIYASGFRNPQRFSWDRGGSGKMYAGDVGQGKIEEIDVVQNGLNYGWNTREGSFDYVNTSTVNYAANPNDPRFTGPIAEYDHDEGIAISGGFVYRGNAIPSLTGKYVFGDLANGRIFYIDPDVTAGGQAALRELKLTEDGTTTKSLLQIIQEGVGASRVDLRFGQDALGNLYILNKQDGTVRTLLPSVVPEPASLAAVGVAMLGLRRRDRSV